MGRKLGNQTYEFHNQQKLTSTGTSSGKEEGKGPLKDYIDYIFKDNLANQNSFEAAEKEMMLNSCYTALNNLKLSPQNIDIFIAGDLLNQIISSGFTASKLGIPFFGIYGACSTLCEGIAIGSMILEAGLGSKIMVATSSHNSSAERQYRYPTEYGYHRRPYSQWTVTGAGAAILSSEGNGPKITSATIGKVVDLGCKDAGNLGAAMAPAAVDTLIQHFSDTGKSPDYYDLILTGDLGKLGHDLAIELAKKQGNLDLSKNYSDCGIMLYDFNNQDVHSGGSGTASSALVVLGYIYKKLQSKELKKVLVVATGAMHSPTSYLQGSIIPPIAHAISLEIE